MSVYLDAGGCHGEEEEKKDSKRGSCGRNQQNWLEGEMWEVKVQGGRC